MKSSLNKILAFFMALAVSFTFGAACLRLPALTALLEARGNINLLGYGLMIILFCLCFLAFYGITSRFSMQFQARSSLPVFAAVLLMTFLSLWFLIRMFQMEGLIYGGVSDRYVWHKLPLWLVLLFLGGELIFFFLCLRGGSLKLPQGAMYILYGILTMLIGYTFYTPSIFVRGASDRLHANAYFNSIYNVYHGSPYTEVTTSIYGHYGILYKLPLKILGGDYIDFILLNAILGALCFLAMFVALHLTVKNNLLRILGCIAMTFPVLAMRGGYYWQLWPHRILFMSLMICFAAFCIRFQKLNLLTCLLGYALSVLAVLWNTESGMFCAIAWAGFWILHHLCSHPFRLPVVLGRGILHLAGIAASFFGAYGIVNLYNIACGGLPNSIREFLFPLLTTSYMEDLLRVDLTLFPSAYMTVLALLFLSLAWGISHMSFFKKNGQRNLTEILLPCFAFFTAVLTLGQGSYYMNRAAYHNLDICHLPCILLLCILAERGMYVVREFRLRERRQYSWGQIFQGSFTAMSLGILLTLVTGTLIQYGYNTDLKTQFHGKEEIHAFAGEIAQAIPKDTYAFGIGTAEIYAMLRWDTQVYTLDYADLSVRPKVSDYVTSDIKNRKLDSFLVGENTVEKHRNFASDQNQWIEENYKVAQKFEFQGCVFKYFVRRK